METRSELEELEKEKTRVAIDAGYLPLPRYSGSKQRCRSCQSIEEQDPVKLMMSI